MIVVVAGLILLKNPSVVHGRPWAEDGLFLLDAIQLPWWQALMTPHTGYIDVVASGAMVIATHLVGRPDVATISVIVALILQMCPAILLVTSRSEWLRPWRLRCC